MFDDICVTEGLKKGINLKKKLVEIDEYAYLFWVI